MESDFIFSLGPNCRTAWNVRHHFGIERAAPFDWWITPARSALLLLDPGFEFHVRREDLAVSAPTQLNSVYNHRLNVLHHHDFPRSGEHHAVLEVSDDDIAKVNSKYAALFDRFHADLQRAQAPVAVLNGIFAGFVRDYQGVPVNGPLNEPITAEEFARTARRLVGDKLRLVIIDIAPERAVEHAWGQELQQPDLGRRDCAPNLQWAEPAHVFKAAFERIPLRLRQG